MSVLLEVSQNQAVYNEPKKGSQVKRKKDGAKNERIATEPKLMHRVQPPPAVQKSESQSAVTTPNQVDIQKLADLPEMKAYALEKLAESTGVKDPDLAVRILDQVSRIHAPWTFSNGREAFRSALEMMLEFKPENITEALLSTQMVGVHNAALFYLCKAAHGGEHSESYVLIATKLMRLYHEQAEVMAKLKGREIQQKVTVEHVHIHKGGQAIVGAVSSTANEAKQSNGK